MTDDLLPPPSPRGRGKGEGESRTGDLLPPPSPSGRGKGEGECRALILVLCLGNAIRRDDGVGLRIAAALAADLPEGARVVESNLSGLYLLDVLDGFDRVVVVDAIRTGTHPPGTVLSAPLEALHAPEGPSPHALGLASVLARAEAFGASVPHRVELVAVEVEDMATVGVGLTAPVEAAIPEAVERVRAAVAALRAP